MLEVLLGCGILSSLTYAAANVFGALRWEGYSSVSQSVSELSAIGAPSRPIVVVLLVAYSLLAIAFGAGVWRAAGNRRPLQIVGALFVAYGLVCLTGPLTPMHVRGAEPTFTDTLHVTATMLDIVFILFLIGFGAASLGKRFRSYSIATLVVMFGCAAWSMLVDGPRIAEGLPTPWVGVVERISIGSFLLWTAVLALALLPGAGRAGARSSS